MSVISYLCTANSPYRIGAARSDEIYIRTIGRGLSSLLIGSRIIPNASIVVAPNKNTSFSPNTTGAAATCPLYLK